MTARPLGDYTPSVAAKEAAPPQGERVEFHVEQDAHVRLLLEDGTVLLVKPIVLDVLRGTQDGEDVYHVRAALNVIPKKPKEST